MEYCNGMMYAVKNGDTLYSISMKYNIPLALLLRANPYVDVYNLQVGETICLPVKKEQGCRYPENGRCIWERGENTEETGMENASGEGRSWRESRKETDGEDTVEGGSGSGNMAGRVNTGAVQGNTDVSDRCGEMSGMDRGMDIEQTMNIEDSDTDDRGNVQWERYVTQPGDTLDIVLGCSGMANREDMDDILEDFVEKNGMSQIYLLPGIVYYRQK